MAIPRYRGTNIQTDMIHAVSGALHYGFSAAKSAMDDPIIMKRWYDHVYKVVYKGFGQALDSRAALGYSSYHHIYEWGHVGSPEGRLWRLKKEPMTSGFVLKTSFVQSKNRVPINPVLKKPGPTGKSVRRSVVFRKKADVMERGAPVFIKARGDKRLIFMGRHGLVFPKSVMINNPGGKDTTGAFARFYVGYFRSGQATKYLQRVGVLDAPARAARGAAEKNPLRAGGFKKYYSEQELEVIAKRNVWAELESRLTFGG